ncbi:MAG: acetyl-CoA carboxylase biotin carboxyl carrier protein subunit [Terriglobales bacterium]
MIYEVNVEGKKHRVELNLANGSPRCRIDSQDQAIEIAVLGHNTLSLLIAGTSYSISRESRGSDFYIWVGSRPWKVEVADPRSWRGRKKLTDNETGPVKLIASMPGKVVRVLTAEGAEVQAGEGVLVVEAMKMQNEIKSPRKGIVQKIAFGEGDNVNAGEVLAIIE